MTTPLWWEGSDSAPAASGPSPYASHHPSPGLAPGLPRPSVPSTADVVIIGAGFTGLWTAHYLTVADPSLDIVVLEAEHVGFGASGRNGGWVSALWPVGPEALARRSGRPAALAMISTLRETVVEVGRAAEQLGIECGFRQGGVVALARSSAQEARARAEVAHSDEWAMGTQWLGPAQASARLAASGLRGATFNPHCARINPRRLVDGLAASVRARGVQVVEGATVCRIEPASVLLQDGHRVRARHIIRATEAWTSRLPGLRREVAPVYSLMVATEPLTEQEWSTIGLADGEVFTDHRHVVIYGQRTVDNRLAFGGRGAPYHFGSQIRPEFDHDAAVFADLRSTLTSILPQLDRVRFTHAWGGPLGIARDWHPSVGYDAATGLGWAGGYVGDGVAATNLAGRTLADLVTRRHTALTELPWVGHHSRRWEPEPLRWLGVNAGLRLAHAADVEEARTGQPARLGRALAALTGH